MTDDAGDSQQDPDQTVTLGRLSTVLQIEETLGVTTPWVPADGAPSDAPAVRPSERYEVRGRLGKGSGSSRRPGKPTAVPIPGSASSRSSLPSRV